MKYLTVDNNLKQIKIDYENVHTSINVQEIIDQKKIVLSEDIFETNLDILDVIEVDRKKYYLHIDKEGKLSIYSNIKAIYRTKFNLKCKMTKKNIFFYGRIKAKFNSQCEFDNVFLNGKKITKVKRMPIFGKFKSFGIIKIPMEAILKEVEFHNSIKIGFNDVASIPLRKKKRKQGICYHKSKRVGEDYIIIRSTAKSSNIIITKINMQPEYKKVNLLKNSIARFISKIIGKKDIVLLFEKETKRAEESGYYIFEKILNKGLKSTKAYFIIDKNSKDYKKIKEKYGKYIVEKYSLRHYLYIYISKYFISSELSNHVLNTRLYIDSLKEEIDRKPLVFLQHGIMFAKPVDNPAAEGFHKGKSSLNIYKNVISSDLEATQFYKMGYNDDDLIKCGLTKFDSSTLNEDADKILFMQTYRYWEEAMINNESMINKTTYYTSCMNVIHAFEKAGMLEKFRISCHPKFAECLLKAAPEYKQIIEPDLTKALAESKVFITDYSSASYDAHYRGAYIIYYWADKEYLIEQYQAIPPINETNCDGVPVYSPDELIKEVKNAINNNYVMEQKYEDNYRKINEFHDGKNGDRLIEELIKLKVLN